MSSVSGVRDTVCDLRGGSTDGLSGVSGVAVLGTNDGEDGTLPVGALSDALIDHTGSLGVRLLSDLGVNVLHDRLGGVYGGKEDND